MSYLTKKDQYLNEQISIKLQFWCKRIMLLGALLFPLFSIADYFVTPENFKKFLIYRITITTFCIIILFLNQLKREIRFQYILIYGMTVMAAITLELLILGFGGHKSIYYGGINLLIVASIGLTPFSKKLAISIGLTIYAVYLFPILIFDRITDINLFIVYNIFIISTFFIAYTWRLITQKLMMNELSLQYDLEQQKKQLEMYSLQLKGMVEDRTKDLRKSEQWHKSLFENATDGVVVLDKNGNIMNANEKASEIHGIKRGEMVGASCAILDGEEKREVMAERMRRLLAGESLVFETVHKNKDGTSTFIEVSSKAIPIEDEVFIQCFHRDITEKKKTQEHLMQSQKLESIGVLAGGIAHDF